MNFSWYQYKMTEYGTVKVRLSDPQLVKLKTVAKNKIGITQRLLSHMIGTDETNFPHNLLLTNRQVAGLYKAFANSSLKDIKLSKN